MNPKFIALVEQNLRFNDEYVDYKFVYSSKHNFFKFVTMEEDNKNFFLNKVIPLKKKVSIPSKINDTDLTENSFIERVLDHCTYAVMKNIKDRDKKKKLKFTKFGKCKLRYVNIKNYNNLTLEEFTKNTTKIVKDDDIKDRKTSEGININEQNQKKQEIQISENEIIDKYNLINLSFFWENLSYPVIANLQMKDKESGLIKLDLYKTKEKCIGTVAINKNKRGSWSFICPDSRKRKPQFRKNLSASGTLKIKSNNFIEGRGYDNNKNKIEFIANKNIYE